MLLFLFLKVPPEQKVAPERFHVLIEAMRSLLNTPEAFQKGIPCARIREDQPGRTFTMPQIIHNGIQGICRNGPQRRLRTL